MKLNYRRYENVKINNLVKDMLASSNFNHRAFAREIQLYFEFYADRKNRGM